MNFHVGALMNPDRAKRVFSLYGPGGVGKTTLASMFKNPFIIRTEDGTASLEALPEELRKNVFSFTEDDKKTPVLFKSTQDVLDGIDWIIGQSHSRETLILDSTTRYDEIARAEVLADEPNVKLRTMAMSHGGYGKSWGFVAAKHMALWKKILQVKNERQMDVVLIHHEMIEEVNPPDAQPYARATLRLHKGSEKSQDTNIQALYFELSDVVGYVRQEFFVNEGKAVGTGRRLVYCDLVPFAATKCRGLTIKEPLAFDLTSNPFEAYL